MLCQFFYIHQKLSQKTETIFVKCLMAAKQIGTNSGQIKVKQAFFYHQEAFIRTYVTSLVTDTY